jgi:exopolyphosphatase/guanosine-5'-triphosphate,3'-diphosphate pyrophosphatase
MILAGIDIGTNTLRLLVADARPDSFHEISSERIITRLGQDLDRTGVLSDDAWARSMSALLDFKDIIRRHNALHTEAIGTSALRKASNSTAFINDVRQRVGLEVRVITGEEEARLTLIGVSCVLRGSIAKAGNNLPTSSLIIDIGGGSTEIIMTRPGAKTVMVSLPLGAVYLTERYIKHDPPAQEELALLRRAVKDELSIHDKVIGVEPVSVFAGTAGTVTTIAAMEQGLKEYDPEKINRFTLTREAIARIVTLLSRSTLNERKRIPGIEPGREDIILAGALVVKEIMERYKYAKMIVSDWGLREGIIIDLYGKVSRNST